MGTVAEADGGGRAADFLHRDHMGKIAKPGTAVGFRHCNAVQAQFAHLRPKVARKLVGAIDMVCARGDLGGGEGADAVAQHFKFIAVVEAQLVLHVGPVPAFGPCSGPRTSHVLAPRGLARTPEFAFIDGSTRPG